jgi:hypothetical protein
MPNCFNGFLALWKEGLVGEVVGGKVGFDGFEIRHAFSDDSGFVFGITELKVTFSHIFQLPLQMNQVGNGC